MKRITIIALLTAVVAGGSVNADAKDSGLTYSTMAPGAQMHAINFCESALKKKLLRPATADFDTFAAAVYDVGAEPGAVGVRVTFTTKNQYGDELNKVGACFFDSKGKIQTTIKDAE